MTQVTFESGVAHLRLHTLQTASLSIHALHQLARSRTQLVEQSQDLRLLSVRGNLRSGGNREERLARWLGSSD